jgi:hypothetical protein
MTVKELAEDLGGKLAAAVEASLAPHARLPRPTLAEELGLWVPTSSELALRAPHP